LGKGELIIRRRRSHSFTGYGNGNRITGKGRQIHLP
jgi:hypothetical protein